MMSRTIRRLPLGLNAFTLRSVRLVTPRPLPATRAKRAKLVGGIPNQSEDILGFVKTGGMAD